MELKNPKHIKYKRGIFSAGDAILSATAVGDSDIEYYIQSPENVEGKLEEFHTLLIDLGQSLEQIRSSIYHRTLSEINSFTGNQTFDHKILFPVDKTSLHRFIARFNRFAKEKKIRGAETERLKAYNAHGILAITYIQQEGQLLCVNIYRLTSERATNLHSFSLRPESKDKFNNSHLGRAHRALHWLDIQAFKEHGVLSYDFCGWYPGTEDQQLLNINAFKEQFTKQKVIEYTGVIYRNKFLNFISKLIR